FLLKRIAENNQTIEDLFLNDITNQNIDEESLIHSRIELGTQKTASVALVNRLIDEVNEERTVATGNVNESMDRSITFLITVNIVSILIGLIIMIIISRIISAHLKKVVNVTTEIADGNLAVEQMDYKGKDEIGQLTN